MKMTQKNFFIDGTFGPGQISERPLVIGLFGSSSLVEASARRAAALNGYVTWFVVQPLSALARFGALRSSRRLLLMRGMS